MNSISDMNSISNMNSIINDFNDDSSSIASITSITNTNTNMKMKLRKEEFVTGHDGSNSPFEIVWICSSIIWSCWCYIELLLLLSSNRSCGNSSSSLSFRLCRHILLESIIIWFPMVLVQTNYLYPYGSILMIFQIILASLLTFRRRRRNDESGNNSDDDNNDNENEDENYGGENEFTIIRDPNNGQLSPVKNPSYVQEKKHDNDDDLKEAAEEDEFDIIRNRSNGRLETIIKKKASSSSQPNNNTNTTNNNNNNNTTTNTTTTNNNNNDNTTTNNLNYVTLYRSTIYYLTFVAIVAVDFELFPRKLCKTEINGYGFMDVGAASFVISSGLIHGKSYIVNNNNSTGSSSLSWSTLFKPLRNAMPLIIIGILRCILNKEMDYQEHVTEYGLHWNFFFTLGVLAIIPTIRKQCILLSCSSTTKSTNNHKNSRRLRLRLRLQGVLKSILIVLPFLSMILYQFFLSSNYYGLQEFILSSPRRLSLVVVPRLSQEEEGAAVRNSIVYDFFLGNREGILGCIGYIFLHSCGELIGQYYIFNNVHDSNVNATSGSGTTSTTSGTNRKGLVASFTSSSLPSLSSSLGSITILLWILHFGIEYLFQFTVSRRTTNLSFCLWSLAHNITLLWSFKTLLLVLTTNLTNTGQSSIHNNYIIPIGMNLINQYGLISFLIANLMTGFINLMIPTIDISDPIAIWIVYIYICSISVVVILYDKLMTMSHNKSTTVKLKLKKKNK